MDDADFLAGPQESPVGLAHLYGDGFQSPPRHVQAREQRRGCSTPCQATRYCDAGKGGRLVCFLARSYTSCRVHRGSTVQTKEVGGTDTLPRRAYRRTLRGVTLDMPVRSTRHILLPLRSPLFPVTESKYRWALIVCVVSVKGCI